MPRNLNELVAFLETRPWLRLTSDLPAGPSGPRRFLRYREGSLWTRDQEGRESFLPLACRAHGSETGLEIDDRGFTVQKFGARLRFDYAEAPA